MQLNVIKQPTFLQQIPMTQHSQPQYFGTNPYYSDNRLQTTPPPPPSTNNGHNVIVNMTPHPPAPIIINNHTASNSGSFCPVCGSMTNSYFQKGIGCITWVWCLILFFFTGICCFIPFCCDSCKETKVVCVKCGCTKITF